LDFPKAAFAGARGSLQLRAADASRPGRILNESISDWKKSSSSPAGLLSDRVDASGFASNEARTAR
jgi:hypothetical protein